MASIWSLLWFGLEVGVGLLVLGSLWILVLRLQANSQRKLLRKQVKQSYVEGGNEEPILVGFFHPYCNDGGGGERVLWCGIRSIQAIEPRAYCMLYYGDEASPEDILARARTRFGINIERSVHFVKLDKREWIESSKYPKFTTLGQSLGSIILGYEALRKQPCDIYLDTMGYAFTYPLMKLTGSRVGCYVHYPTVSTDMLTRVAERRIDYNNNQSITTSSVLSTGKLYYYKMFASLYGFFGRWADMVMVNSTWTKNNIDRIWNMPKQTFTVFPPCNTDDLSLISIDTPRKPFIISVAQFRGEKNHHLQLVSFKKLLESSSVARKQKLKLVLIGSCRNNEDQQRIDALKKTAIDLGIKDEVEFEINIPYPDMKRWLSCALIGLHTMWCEHFGIGIVELMAAGVIVVAHNSGGPKSDIVVKYRDEVTGYLAATPEEYVSAMQEILEKGESDLKRIREAARASTARFSEDAFHRGVERCFDVLKTPTL
eukprot:TRINITY_DN14020_c0_g1_i1.p1 TRINITY_DN14020_c0_g1~~TRINITY_DN14020_c0_g1_i1.p1  ORF type:complete len:485 (+),score=70.19 TRINITY_DN14020_c0_g1_i1:175-1629(+)